VKLNSSNENKVVFDNKKLLEILPHRYPFLLVDKIIELVEGEKIVGIKAVAANEPCFQGHFPNAPVMPGVLIMEAMAQVGAVLATVSSGGLTPGKLIFLAGANDFRWKRPVVPGDLLRIEMVTIKRRNSLWKMKGCVLVDDIIVASGEITAAESEY
jgi:3-hydroxyacyl-[acyl-carrier-protein] dehydratase